MLVEASQTSSFDYLKIAIGLAEKLSLFKQKSVAKISQRSDFRLCDINKQPTLLIIGDRLKNQRAAKLASLMLNYLFSHVYNRGHGQSNMQIPLYFILDEAPRHKTKINLAEILAVAQNANTSICLAAQDVTQFGNERETAEILNNCNTIITTKGVPPESAAFLSRMLGKRKVAKATIQKKTLLDYWEAIDRGESLWSVLFSKLLPGKTSVRYVDAHVLGDREIMYPPVGNYPGIVLVSPLFGKPILVGLNLAHRTI